MKNKLSTNLDYIYYYNWAIKKNEMNVCGNSMSYGEWSLNGWKRTKMVIRAEAQTD